MNILGAESSKICRISSSWATSRTSSFINPSSSLPSSWIPSAAPISFSSSSLLADVDINGKVIEVTSRRTPSLLNPSLSRTVYNASHQHKSAVGRRIVDFGHKESLPGGLPQKSALLSSLRRLQNRKTAPSPSPSPSSSSKSSSSQSPSPSVFKAPLRDQVIAISKRLKSKHVSPSFFTTDLVNQFIESIANCPSSHPSEKDFMYYVLISCCFRQGMLEEASLLFDRSRSLPYSSRSTYAFIQGLCKHLASSKNNSVLMQFLDPLFEESPEFELSRHTWNILFHHAAITHDAALLFRCLDWVSASRQMEMNIATFNALLRASIAANRADMVPSVLEAMKSKGIRPNGNTLDILFSSCANSEDLKAIREYAANNGTHIPKFTTVGPLVRALVKLHDPDAALSILTTSSSIGKRPDRFLYELVLSQLAKQGSDRIDACLGVLRQMRLGWLKPSIVSLRKVLAAASTSRNVETISSIYRYLYSSFAVPGRKEYESLTELYEKCKELSDQPRSQRLPQ